MSIGINTAHRPRTSEFGTTLESYRFVGIDSDSQGFISYRKRPISGDTPCILPVNNHRFATVPGGSQHEILRPIAGNGGAANGKRL